jgi:hypothetical protein
LPLEPQQHVDGLSFKGLVTGEADTIDRDTLYWHYPHGVFQGVARKGDYKLVYAYKTGEAELFNMAADPGEHEDLSGREPERLAEMKGLLRTWLAETGAKFPAKGVVRP